MPRSEEAFGGKQIGVTTGPRMVWLGLLFGLTALAGFIGASHLYIRFASSPEKAWRDQVLNLARAAAIAARHEGETIENLSLEHDREEQALREKAFSSYLKSISVDHLESYAGIGPGTISRLRQVGHANLASLRNASLHIHGLGQKRQADIEFALQDLLAKAEGRFNAGACKEAQALLSHVAALSSQYGGLRVRAEVRAKALKAFVERMREKIAVAQSVTLARYMWQDAYTLVPKEFLEEDLPDLEKELHRAEQRATGAYAQTSNSDKNNNRPAPVLPISSKGAKPVDVRRPDPASARPLPKPAPKRDGKDVLPAKREPGASPVPAPVVRPPVEEKPADRYLEIMELAIQLAYAIARADGPITAKEREVLEWNLLTRYNYDPALLNRARAFCTHYESAPIDFHLCIQRIAKVFSPAHQSAIVNLVAQMMVSSSGGIDSRTAEFLDRASRWLGVAATIPKSANKERHFSADAGSPSPPASEPNANTPNTLQIDPVSPSAVDPLWREQRTITKSGPHAIIQPAPALSRADYLSLLEIEPSTPLTGDLIRRQFNLLSERFAEERLRTLGDEFAAIAKTKREAIHEAARALLEEVGEKLEIGVAADALPDLRHNPDLDDVFGV